MDSTPSALHPWILSLAYLVGVVLTLTAVAALLTYVIDPEGYRLGKLNSFGWIWLINVLLALPGCIAFWIGVRLSGWQMAGVRRGLHLLAALVAGGLMVGVYLLLRPLYVLTPAPFAMTVAHFVAAGLLLPPVANWLSRWIVGRRT